MWLVVKSNIIHSVRVDFFLFLFFTFQGLKHGNLAYKIFQNLFLVSIYTLDSFYTLT